MNVVIIKKDDGTVYLHNEKRKFTNLSTGNSGELTKEVASENFLLPVKLNAMIEKNPALLEVIVELGLAVDQNRKNSWRP